MVLALEDPPLAPSPLVLVVDASASMAAREGKGTRLDLAKGMAFALDRPFYAVHHLEGHIAAAWPEGLPPPFLALVASGGHTHLYEVLDLGRYRLLGATRDDAAGEAFDKVARLLGLGFPGGPEVERLAEEAEEAIPFPVPLRGQEGYDFSFSGLKTKALHLVEKGLPKAALAKGFQEAAIAHLAEVVLKAAKDTGHRVLLVAGGVAANRALQERFKEAGLEVHFPPRGLSQDNGAMIALAAWRRHQRGFPPSPLSLGATAYWPLEEA